MVIEFKKAVKHEAKLRMALIGPAGSGKTYTALSIAKHLGERIALMDTEHGSASKYADLFEFDSLAPNTFNPTVYIEAIQVAEENGYDVLILDSLSHAWAGKGGLLEFVDQQAKRAGGNSFAAWRDATPLHNQLIDAMLACNLHLIVTMRSKMDYVVEKDEKTGKNTVRKVGLQPVQRDGLEYEFDVTADLDLENNLIVSKTRCPTLKGGMYPCAGQDVAEVIKAWLSGVPVPTKRHKMIDRIQELAEEINGKVKAKKDKINLDEAWLFEADEDQLIDEGKRLAEIAKNLNGKEETAEQPELLEEAA